MSESPVDLGAIGRDGKMQIARALAIEEYTMVESNLARLFAALLGTADRKGSIVFFALLNARSRNSTLESLLQEQHGNKYDAYWYGEPGRAGKPKTPGLITLIRQLDDERNRIVHWHPVQKIDGTKSSEVLLPPHFWHRAPTAVPITIESLTAFAQKASFVHRSIAMFYAFTTMQDRLRTDTKQTWLEIFARPALYPPSNTHPLSLNYKAPETPPRSSEA
jgi:hypothetical protein